VFCALHDQLASLGRHAQLTRCFSAVAELLVKLALVQIADILNRCCIRSPAVAETRVRTLCMTHEWHGHRSPL